MLPELSLFRIPLLYAFCVPRKLASIQKALAVTGVSRAGPESGFWTGSGATGKAASTQRVVVLGPALRVPKSSCAGRSNHAMAKARSARALLQNTALGPYPERCIGHPGPIPPDRPGRRSRFSRADPALIFPPGRDPISVELVFGAAFCRADNRHWRSGVAVESKHH
jgi:hypothetical protein